MLTVFQVVAGYLCCSFELVEADQANVLRISLVPLVVGDGAGAISEALFAMSGVHNTADVLLANRAAEAILL